MRYFLSFVLVFAVGCGSKQRFNESLQYADANVANMYRDVQQIKQGTKDDYVKREMEMSDEYTALDISDEETKYQNKLLTLKKTLDAKITAIAADDPDREAKLKSASDEYNIAVQKASAEYTGNIQFWEKKRLERYSDVHDQAKTIDQKFSGIDESFKQYNELREGQNKYLEMEQRKAISIDRAFDAGSNTLRRILERRRKKDAESRTSNSSR